MLSPFERDGNVYTYKNWQYEKDLYNESKREFALREVGTAYKEIHISLHQRVMMEACILREESFGSPPEDTTPRHAGSHVSVLFSSNA
jgi:hypothetical protein